MEPKTNKKVVTAEIDGIQVSVNDKKEVRRLLERKASKFHAGQIKTCQEQWKGLTSDTTILSLIKGTKIELKEELKESKRAPDSSYMMSREEQKIIDMEIQGLLNKGVIERSRHEEGEFVSGIFTRKKSDGSHRMILNLKKFNEIVEYKKFKMDTLKIALNLITPNCWMASVDLVSAYYSVPIAKEDRKYLKFLWKGTLYEYTCYSNGLAQCPRCFTKLTKPIYAHLHSLGHMSTGYLDDSLLIADDINASLRNIGDTITIFDRLGFAVHPTKSILYPTQEITYLGFIINSINMTIRLTEKRITTILDFCSNISNNRLNSIRNVARLIGLLVASFPAVPYGPLYYRHLEKEKMRALKSNRFCWEKSMSLSKTAIKEIKWWTDNISTSFNHITQPDPELIITTDASLIAWGAASQGMRTGGAWLHEEVQTMHINELELFAAFLGLKSFAKKLRNVHIRIYIDNTVAMACLNKMGSSKSSKLNKLSRQVWEWCIERSIWLSAARIAGIDNVEADSESRNINLDTEWKLDSELLQDATTLLKVSPEIDLFASRLNNQCKKYISYRPDPDAIAIDAFTINWKGYMFFAFPPFSLLPRVLQKISKDVATGIIVAPYWPAQPFFPQLMSMLTDYPILLSARRRLLSLPSHPERLHPLHKKLRLMICKVSGNSIEKVDFRRRLQRSSWDHGDLKPKRFMTHTSKGGETMRIGSKWIRFRHL